LKRGLYLWRKGLFKFEELVSVLEDGDYHGSCEFVLIHLPQSVEEMLGVQTDA